MNEFDGWTKILSEWKDIVRVNSLNQQLYDQLVGAIIYIQRYSEKNNISLPNRDQLEALLNNSEKIIDDINQTVNNRHVVISD
jgi:hypothetical protein